MHARSQLNRWFRCLLALGPRALMSALILLGGCEASRTQTDQAPAPPDAGSSPPIRPIDNADGCRGLPCREDRDCVGSAHCRVGVCLTDFGSCTSGDDCPNDQRCYDGGCIPFALCSQLVPFDLRCLGGSFSPDQFRSPQVRCHLRDRQVMATPVVADLDQDGKPEVIATAFPDILLALRPSDCSIRFERKGVSLLSAAQAQLSVADLDADGFAEIVTIDAEQRVVVFNHQGILQARSDHPLRERNPAGVDLWSAPFVTDLDGKSPPEIVVGAQVSRYVPGAPARIETIWTQPNLSASWGSVSVVSDLDDDGVAEVITSDRIYDGKTGADKTPASISTDPFFAQVADFSGDGKPDLLLVESTSLALTIQVYDYANRRVIFGPYTQQDSSGIWGGPAAIADLDHDGTPDFVIASAKSVTAYALRCTQRPKPRGCLGFRPGVLWTRPIDDYSSGATGVSAIDLNGDGIAEVISRDECWLRIFSGLDGRVLAARSVMSSTGLELPVVADADGDGRADLVVSSDVPNDNLGACLRVGVPEQNSRTPWGGAAGGILILTDPQNRWTKTRPIWNQHAYQITNISDSLQVPIPTIPHWTQHNSVRTNTSERMPAGSLPASYDLTARIDLQAQSARCDSAWMLSAFICNRGGADSPATTEHTFYDGDPDRGAESLCTATLSAVLQPGDCREVRCAWNHPRRGPLTLYLRAGDNGKGSRALLQCSSNNDIARATEASCQDLPG